MATSIPSSLLVLLCLSACAPARQEAAPPAPSRTACVPASAASPAPAATSKLRHIPDENTGCPNSQGLAPR